MYTKEELKSWVEDVFYCVVNGGNNRQYFITRIKVEDEEDEYDIQNLWVGSRINDYYDEIIFHTSNETLEDFGFAKEDNRDATERDYFSTLLSDISSKIYDEFGRSKFLDDLEEAIREVEKEMDDEEPYFGT